MQQAGPTQIVSDLYGRQIGKYDVLIVSEITASKLVGPTSKPSACCTAPPAVVDAAQVVDGGGSMPERFDDDDELLVQACAVLKSQGPENWPRGRPG